MLKAQLGGFEFHHDFLMWFACIDISTTFCVQ